MQRQQRLFGADGGAKSGKGLGGAAVEARGLGVSRSGQSRQPLAVRAAALLQAVAKEHLSAPPSSFPGADLSFPAPQQCQHIGGKTCVAPHLRNE